MQDDEISKSCMGVFLSGCGAETTKSYTFNITNGDQIKVELNTSEGLSLSQADGQFSVTEDDEEILKGIFIEEEVYNQYVAIKGEQGMEVLEDTEKDGNTYYMYEVEGETGTEDNFVMWIEDSNTGVIMGSLAGQEKAKDAFEQLTITKAE